MANNVVFQDFSWDVKAELNETSIAWLEEVTSEIESHAKRNCSTGESYSSQLKAAYKHSVDAENGIGEIYNDLEQAFWEEFGTGSYADTKKNGGKKGREGWWVWKDNYKGDGGPILTEQEAKAKAAASDGTVHATNGKKPNYTLEKAYLAKKKWGEQRLEEKLAERMK